MTGVVPGLTVLPDYVTPAEAAGLLARVDAEPWLDDLKRRVQHHGYRYDYKRREVTADAFLGPLPDWLGAWAERLHREGHIERAPDQVIVNEYQPGQGIAAHVDCVPCFGPTVLSLSLNSGCELVLTPLGGGAAQPVLLAPRSLLILAGESRVAWRHAIPARQRDHGVARTRRVSLTFRTVKGGAP
jgi:alkylated DNA repair dioxygenase AlkB